MSLIILKDSHEVIRRPCQTCNCCEGKGREMEGRWMSGEPVMWTLTSLPLTPLTSHLYHG